MLYKFITMVKSVEFRERVVSGRMVGEPGNKTAVLEKEALGWYINFEGSWESLYFGDEKPELVKGQKVEISVKGL